MSEKSDHWFTIKVRCKQSLATILLDEYYRASKVAHERGLEPPELPPGLETVKKIDVGEKIIEIPCRSSTFEDPRTREVQ